MTWEYGLIGLIVGMLIGALAMRFGNRDLRQQQKLKNELDRRSIDFEEYRQELVGHFARNAELLDNMARDYRQLYQHIAKNSNNLLPDLPLQDNSLHSHNRNNESDGDKPQVKVPPLDYF
ncbi:Z-ring associated protein ZapG [Candidatus Regiella endosymbiont of Tuberolachnus salignus]|uniref:Z-ring associated protein ZapG n=1 Tax=Candidatus Regiella endosymbiont of Tuberolachnus salignus TaxID=3077956 RepID=UPI0030CF206C